MSLLPCLITLATLSVVGSAQSPEKPGSIEGTVTRADGTPVEHASVLVTSTGQTVETDHEGRYRIADLAPGTYELFAYASTLTSALQLVAVGPGETVRQDFVLLLTPLRENVTVSASGRHETTFQAVQSVATLDSVDLAENLAPSVGELLAAETGVAKRSFGPGSSRPVIRGFDGDRVVVLSDGLPAGGLGSQSGDHGEPIDATTLERIEIVKGPATLLYGSSALGGVVNAISRHHEMHRHRHAGHRARLLASAGSNNELLGTGGAFEYGKGPWMWWGSGGGQRIGDYTAGGGEVIANSAARTTNGGLGLGWFGSHWFWTAGYQYREGRYGIPFASLLHGEHDHEAEHEPGLVASLSDQRLSSRPGLSAPQGIGRERLAEDGDHPEEDFQVDVGWDYHQVRLTGGWLELDGPFPEFSLTSTYTRWKHRELEVLADGEENVGTRFDNEQWILRGELAQRQKGPWSGTVGFQAQWRDYLATGEEALAPPVDQFGFALFALEEWRWERWRLQAGARLEHVRYRPNPWVTDAAGPGPADTAADTLPERRFTGLSLAAGARYALTGDNTLVLNFSSSFRPPALEELYNFGPHLGNLAFEIGNPELDNERSNGFEVSFRHAGERLRGELNLFAYYIADFIFLAPTGEVVGNLLEQVYRQGDSRYLGAEAKVDVALHENIWWNLGADLVDAELRPSGTSLPRIPPARIKTGLDFRSGNLSLRPELVAARAQRQIFATETPTAGYGLVNLKVSYTLPRRHVVHHFSAEVFNLGDRLYRNHVSLIKDLAPEIGRGVRFSYVMELF
ncbi:MAG: TonB-dependent receptor [Acidobacteriota bacterium]